MKDLSKYNKYLVALVTVLVNGLLATYGASPALMLAVQFLGAFGVYQIPNKK